MLIQISSITVPNVAKFIHNEMKSIQLKSSSTECLHKVLLSADSVNSVKSQVKWHYWMLSLLNPSQLQQWQITQTYVRKWSESAYLTNTVCLTSLQITPFWTYILGFKEPQCNYFFVTRPCIFKARALLMASRLGGVFGGGHRLVVKEGIVVGHPRLSAASIVPGLGPGAVRNRAE